MKRIVPALAAALIATIGASSAAQAKMIDFGVVGLGGTITYSGSMLQGSTALNLDAAILAVSNVSASDASGLKVFPNLPTLTDDTVTVSPTDIMYGSGTGTVDAPLGTDVVKSWTDSLGTFTETLTTVDTINRGTANAITVTLEGTLTGPGFVSAPVALILSANQAGGPGNTVSAALTNTSTSTVPEPSTWVMLALGFVGLGYAAVRRSAKDRSAVAI
jgi:hypothetical protein